MATKKFTDDDFKEVQEIYDNDTLGLKIKMALGYRYYSMTVKCSDLTSNDPHIQKILDQVKLTLEDMVNVGEIDPSEMEEWKEYNLEVFYWGDDWGNAIEVTSVGPPPYLQTDSPDYEETIRKYPLNTIIPIKLVMHELEDSDVYKKMKAQQEEDREGEEWKDLLDEE